jgi:hypothetical protein
MSYGVIDYLATAPRYTTLIEVKKALNINDTDLDDDIDQAIIAAELQIDQFNGRSFPDNPTQEPVHGDEIDGVPSSISLWALSASIGVLKLRDTVYGSGGSDEWIGSIDVQDQVRKALTRNPLALGFKRVFGVA